IEGILGFLMNEAATTFGASSEADVLLKFKSSLDDEKNALANWNGGSPCAGEQANWIGVLCTNGSVWGLQLENMGLEGEIDVDTLMGLPSLRTLSFMNNNFDGPMPEIKKLEALKSLFLSHNRFSGEIPANAFEGMSYLKKLHLAGNQFKGAIPSSLTQLPRLLELSLEGNQFTGQVPEFEQNDLLLLNVSNNQLDGPIPASLANMNSSSFSGNKGLCGGPLSPCTPASPPDEKKSPSSTSIMIFAIVAGVLLLITIILLILCLRRRNLTSQSIEAPPPSNLQKKASFKEEGHFRHSSPDDSSNGKKAENFKLSFVRDDREKFDLQDLLKASAEILGSGCFGSSYKAALFTGPAMVVKRFRQMNNVGREEFQEHMRRLGRLRHPNLLPLVAYYYRKEEKLLVSDYVENGSLAVYLHSNHARGKPALDWPTRLKIVKGVAKGLGYLYNELPSLIAPHGHLKSSNVLLTDSFEPLVTDYGLIPVINQENAQDLMVAYKSPEYLQNKRITKKTDVWSLGILILEILTGKFPANFLQQGQQGSDQDDLASWVRLVAGEADQWPAGVFDKEMRAKSGSEGEMLRLLKIGLRCCEGDFEKRWDMKEAVEKIEEVREKDNDDEFYSSYASESDVRSSRGLSDEISYSIPI
ncbi:Protein kinase domain-containing protein, partial [Psidium guajava]